MYRINQDDQCVICLGQLVKGDLIRWLPNCGHVFHVSCIDNWFHAHINCPICRSLVRGTASSGRGGVDGCGPSGGGCRRGLPRTRSGGRLCHSTKMTLPIQGLGPRDLVKFGLRRSLSMDECSVVIDTREQTTTTSSSSLLPNNNSSCNNPSLSKIEFLLSRLYQAPSSIRRYNNYMSSMGSRSLHGSRAGQGGTLRNNSILPY
ncbi:RING-H2 finger protein ATL11-like [Chenopodium quinoa]|uniref:RING-H2 finger protein ATL11-like n=1 Tax=Chenopodium quinoa TaxID=63459 RepID=UPI000B783C2C|nr:RING-H2 finger protein ATL11-like [Chenopodium quinoa]